MGQRFSRDHPRASWASVLVELNGRRLEHHAAWDAWFVEGHTPADPTTKNRRINRSTVGAMLRVGLLIEVSGRGPDMSRLLEVKRDDDGKAEES